MPTPRPGAPRRRQVLLALAGTLALAAPAAAGPLAAPTDSTEALPSAALAWARHVVGVRQSVEAAEAERDPDRQAALAADAFADAQALAADPGAHADGPVRSLVLRAQAVYEAHHGPARTLPLSRAELAALRADALADLARSPLPVFEDPAVAAAERAAAAEAARAAEAQAARAAGPAHLFYPAEAEALVAEQRAVAHRFARLRSRMRRHFPAVERTLRRRGLPTDLRVVALIESALDPAAESGAGARGLWQFMPETAAEYGLDSLTVADPAASTAAAARYLQWLGRRFRGDWQLALAAYNCGVGRVERLAQAYRAETGRRPTFWDLRDRLPTETQAYVPRFIAVAEALGARRG